MDKTQEIELLDKTIRAFGPNSYLGPWLAENRMLLIDQIQSDFSPNAMMPAQARREAQRIIDTAHADAQKVRDCAADAVSAELQKAADDVTRTRERAARMLEDAANDVRRGYR
jgi:DNA repair ATPase RecN